MCLNFATMQRKFRFIVHLSRTSTLWSIFKCQRVLLLLLNLKLKPLNEQRKGPKAATIAANGTGFGWRNFLCSNSGLSSSITFFFCTKAEASNLSGRSLAVTLLCLSTELFLCFSCSSRRRRRQIGAIFPFLVVNFWSNDELWLLEMQSSKRVLIPRVTNGKLRLRSEQILKVFDGKLNFFDFRNYFWDILEF